MGKRGPQKGHIFRTKPGPVAAQADGFSYAEAAELLGWRPLHGFNPEIQHRQREIDREIAKGAAYEDTRALGHDLYKFRRWAGRNWYRSRCCNCLAAADIRRDIANHQWVLLKEQPLLEQCTRGSETYVRTRPSITVSTSTGRTRRINTIDPAEDAATTERLDREQRPDWSHLVSQEGNEGFVSITGIRPVRRDDGGRGIASQDVSDLVPPD